MNNAMVSSVGVSPTDPHELKMLMILIDNNLVFKLFPIADRSKVSMLFEQILYICGIGLYLIH